MTDIHPHPESANFLQAGKWLVCGHCQPEKFTAVEPCRCQCHAPQPEDELIDEMARDFSSVIPKSKSEIRSRISSLLQKAREEVLGKVMSYVETQEKELALIDKDGWGSYEEVGVARHNEIKALRSFLASIKE